MSITEARENYRRMSEHGIRQIALYEVRDLTTEGVHVLQATLRERGLSTDFMTAVDGQLDEFSVLKYADLLEWLRDSACPRCGGLGNRLNAVSAVSVSSFILVTKRAEDVVVACPNCLVQATNKARLRSALFGWWAVPWGPVETIAALAENASRCRLATSEESTDILIAYLYANLGRLLVQMARDANPFEEPD